MALGKAFAECPTKDTRQRGLCRHRLCRVIFAEGYTRQRLCRVPVKHSAKKSCLTAPIDGDGRFAERLTEGTRQSPPSLPSVSPTTLGKGGHFAECLMGGTRQRQGGFVECFTCGTRQSLPAFAECNGHSTRQSLPALPSVLVIALGIAGKFAFFCIFLFIASTHTYITQPSHIYHISHNNHIYHTAITYNP